MLDIAHQGKGYLTEVRPLTLEQLQSPQSVKEEATLGKLCLNYELSSLASNLNIQG